MPSQSTEAHVRISIPLIRYLQRESLTALEHNISLYIIEHSLNFAVVRNHGMPQWVEISPSKFAEEFGYHRVAVSKALSRIEHLGVFDVTVLKKMGVEYRSFRVVERSKILQALADVTKSNLHKPSRKNPETVAVSLQDSKENIPDSVANSLRLKSTKSNKGSLDCSHTRYGHVAPETTALYSYALRPCSLADYRLMEKADKFKGLGDSQECINNIQKYIRTRFEFSGVSYYETVLTVVRSRRERRNLSITLKRSIDQYGLFSVFIATNAHLVSKTLHFGNFDVLNSMLKNDRVELAEHWEKILMQIDNLFFKLNQYQIDCESRLQDFDLQAKLYLTSLRADENYCSIYLFETIEEDLLRAHLLSCGSIDGFRSRVVKNINNFFKFKIYGEHEFIREVVSDELLN